MINLISNKKNITSLEIKDVFNISSATLKRDLKQLREENRIEYIGSSKNGYWLIKTSKDDNK
ncbi:HTH domain-containing protein [Mycoplasma procyoni]|uniref:HTH domain-containing protein n=1 Tax=Mycoplasma procyoni TaxID=568784 RepID=UPI00358F9525